MLLQILIASTRHGRMGDRVGRWFDGVARSHGQFEVELIDLAQQNLPLLDEPMHPRLRQYQHEHTRAWSATIMRGDAYVFVTPEYNYGSPPALLNALDYLLHEWGYKPAGFVSYGGVSAGTRSMQMTKQVLAGLRMVPVVEAVTIPFFSQHIDKETGVFAPPAVQQEAAVAMLNEMKRWAEALLPLRPVLAKV